MRDMMEHRIPKSFTFINHEGLSETLASDKKHLMKSTGNQKRLNGGADHRISTCASKTSNKNQSFDTPVSNGVQKIVEQTRYSTHDVQLRTASALDSLRALAGSELTKAYDESTNSLLQSEEESSKKRRSMKDSPTCFCASYATRSNGEKKSDEMMEYAIQNLNEAGKALTNLGDNFEHDLKLMFMDIMGRVQHWVSVVQNRIHAAKADLESLRKESIARESEESTKDLELIALRNKLGEAEASLAAQQKWRSEIMFDAAEQATRKERERVSTSAQTASGEDKVEGGNELESESAAALANTGIQCEDEREEVANREAELEAELARLLEENERMTIERSEYENAVHCALLKGVSSLNTEALKVLRHPPIPCCTPCGFTSLEPVVTHHPKTTRCDAFPPQPLQRGSNPVSKNEKADKIKSQNNPTSTNCCQLPSEISKYYSGGNAKSQENSTLFLLHHGDAGNQCQPSVQSRYRTNGTPSTKGTVCVGGKCRKPVTNSTKQKLSSATRSSGSRLASYDLCVRNKDGNFGFPTR